MSLVSDRRTLDFILFEVLNIGKYLGQPPFGAFDRETVNGFLDTAESIALRHYLPCAAQVDANDPQFDGKTAIVHPTVKPALAQFAEAGFLSAGFSEADGGLGAPLTVLTAANGMFSCANLSIHNYSMLTIAAGHLIRAFGTAEQKTRYLTPLIEGRWFGTMCLSETQAGSSLSDIRTLATPLENGRYSISGSKMWISGGDQNITQNIVHMVLARTPNAPAGVKGLSLFIVPKMRVFEDGQVNHFNYIALAGLNHKMGNRGTTNTLLNFGEGGVCEGELIGELHQGLHCMFHMMNEARISVGHGAAMQGLGGYLHALEYARGRAQGRPISNKDPLLPQVPIIQHADVKRLLLAQMAAVEGAMALVSYAAQLVDDLAIAESDQSKTDCVMLLDLLTPIVKSWPSEFCLEANKHAIQVLGGYGYTKDYPVERFYRDNRLNHIHEGTHGIHGLDILGRKVQMQEGAALDLLVNRMQETINAAAADSRLLGMSEALRNAIASLRATTKIALAEPDLTRRLANATLYLDGMGHIVVAWMWLKMGQAASEALAEGRAARDFYEGKLLAMAYFYRFELPNALAKLSLVATLDDTTVRMASAHFGND